MPGIIHFILTHLINSILSKTLWDEKLNPNNKANKQQSQDSNPGNLASERVSTNLPAVLKLWCVSESPEELINKTQIAGSPSQSF